MLGIPCNLNRSYKGGGGDLPLSYCKTSSEADIDLSLVSLLLILKLFLRAIKMVSLLSINDISESYIALIVSFYVQIMTNI